MQLLSESFFRLVSKNTVKKEIAPETTQGNGLEIIRQWRLWIRMPFLPYLVGSIAVGRKPHYLLPELSNLIGGE